LKKWWPLELGREVDLLFDFEYRHIQFRAVAGSLEMFASKGFGTREA
jgi:hypothetical protein